MPESRKEPTKNAPKIIYRSKEPKNNKKPVKVRRIDDATPGLLRFTLSWIYKNLYILGITLLRKRLVARRKRRRFFAGMRGRMADRFVRLGRGLAAFGKSVVAGIQAPFVKLANVRKQMRPVIAQSKQDGTVPFRAYLRIVGTFFKLLYTILRTLINYAIPVAAAVFLFNMVTEQMDRNIGLEVTYNGQTIGFVKNEADFESAARIIKDRYISDDTTALISVPSYTLMEAEQATVPDPEDPEKTITGPEEYTTVNDLADAILRNSQGEIAEGFGFYVDGVFYGAVAESDPVFEALDKVQEDNSTGAYDEELGFVNSLKLEPGVYPIDSMVEEEEITQLIWPAEEYTVPGGEDPLTDMAQGLGLSVTDLLEYNPQLEEEALVPGQKLSVYRAKSVMTVKNIFTEVYDVPIPYSTEEIPTDNYVVGYRAPSVVGVPGVEQRTATVAMVGGQEISREVLDRVVLRQPVTEKIVVGTHDPKSIPPGTEYGSVSEAGFLWPTSGGYINGSVGSYAGHTGCDIPRPAGTPIFASMSGVVVTAKNTGVGYGRYVVIDHGNGYTTLYAHASALHVTVGQVVKQGDIIASVGRTGRATGNHVHFEIRRNGQIMDPVLYISK